MERIFKLTSISVTIFLVLIAFNLEVAQLLSLTFVYILFGYLFSFFMFAIFKHFDPKYSIKNLRNMFGDLKLWTITFFIIIFCLNIYFLNLEDSNYLINKNGGNYFINKSDGTSRTLTNTELTKYLKERKLKMLLLGSLFFSFSQMILIKKIKK